MKKKTPATQWKGTTAKQRTDEMRTVARARWHRYYRDLNYNALPFNIGKPHPGFTVPQVATILEVRARTVRRWIADGSLAARKPGTSYRFLVPVAEVIRVLEERRVEVEQRAAAIEQRRRAEIESIVGVFRESDLAP